MTVLSFRKVRTVAAAIAASGLSDEAIAELLASEFTIHVRPSLVRLWRDGTAPAPAGGLADFLIGLRPRSPARIAVVA